MQCGAHEEAGKIIDGVAYTADQRFRRELVSCEVPIGGIDRGQHSVCREEPE